MLKDLCKQHDSGVNCGNITARHVQNRRRQGQARREDLHGNKRRVFNTGSRLRLVNLEIGRALAPPDILLGGFFANNALVHGGTPHLIACNSEARQVIPFRSKQTTGLRDAHERVRDTTQNRGSTPSNLPDRAAKAPLATTWVPSSYLRAYEQQHRLVQQRTQKRNLGASEPRLLMPSKN